MSLGEWAAILIIIGGLLGVLIWVVKAHKRSFDASMDAGAR
jgi:uncharacterized membrane protein